MNKYTYGILAIVGIITGATFLFSYLAQQEIPESPEILGENLETIDAVHVTTDLLSLEEIETDNHVARFRYTFENTSDKEIRNISIINNLANAFPNGQFKITELSGSPLALNSDFDGVTVTELAATGTIFEPGAQHTVSVSVEFVFSEDVEEYRNTVSIYGDIVQGSQITTPPGGEGDGGEDQDNGDGGIKSDTEIGSINLVNASTKEDIRPLQNGDVLYLSEFFYGRRTLRAVPIGNPVGSVDFTIDDVFYSVQNDSPFLLEGVDNGEYIPWFPAPGKFKVVAIPYPNKWTEGGEGTMEIINLEIINDLDESAFEDYTLLLEATYDSDSVIFKLPKRETKPVDNKIDDVPVSDETPGNTPTVDGNETSEDVPQVVDTPIVEEDIATQEIIENDSEESGGSVLGENTLANTSGLDLSVFNLVIIAILLVLIGFSLRSITNME